MLGVCEEIKDEEKEQVGGEHEDGGLRRMDNQAGGENINRS